MGLISDLKARLGRKDGSTYKSAAHWSDYKNWIDRIARGDTIEAGEWFEALDIATALGDPAYTKLYENGKRIILG
jgi:hypothetical protein